MILKNNTKFKETEIGLIPKEWGVVNIPTVAKNFDNQRKPLSSAEREKMIGNYPYYGAAGIIDHVDSYIFDGKYLLIAEDGTVTNNEGYPTLQLTNGKFWVSNHAHILQCENYEETKFLYYALKNQKINAFVTGAVQPKLNQENLNSILFPYPVEKLERFKILEILSSLDDKIELNRKINANLEKMASALFKKWFVDMGSQSKGQENRFLKDSIVDSINGDWGQEQEGGEFTKKVFCIRGADITELKNGGTGKMPVRFIKEKNFTNRGLRNGDIVVEISGGSPTQSTGRSVLITNELLSRFEYPLICSNFCKVVRFKEIEYTGFYFTLLNEMYNRDEFFQYENGTSGIKNLDLSSFFEDAEFCASNERILKFSLFYLGSYKGIQENGLQSYNLSFIRNLLLPRLMSGRIRVNL